MREDLVTYDPSPSNDPPPPEIHQDFIDILQLRSLGELNTEDSLHPEESPPPPAN